MSTLKVNNIESFTGADPVRINDQLITGNATAASGNYSHAEGNLTIASGIGSHAEGNQTQAVGDYSHAEGYKTSASGDYSHAEGYKAQSIGVYSHAEGDQTQALKGYSHAEGKETVSSASYSHSEGGYTECFTNYSHAEGYKTIASASNSSIYTQHVQGQLNATGSGAEDALMIIGNGTSTSNRSNLAEFHLSKFIFDVDALPTSSVSTTIGQLYRTGSGFDEIRIKL